ncbi:MAG: ABC transporter substrate-binding protein [Vallitaleaceae bacterium]|jgi:iron complex transport system substrate-binding protein|nr:ABC transporter substrate-binding protein [Vallitaleaceae bacterium]
MKKLLTVLMAMMMVTALAGCGQTTTEAEATTAVTTVAVTEVTTEAETAIETTEAPVVENNYPMTLTDKYGNEIVIEEQPQSIISMSPELTEILYALGAADKMIGRSSYCNFPAETADVQDFGTLFDLNIESIVAAAPDVVFLSSMASEELVNSLLDNELTVIAVDKDSNLQGTYEHFALVGSVIGEEEAAEALTMEVQAQIAAVEEKVAGLEAPTVYYSVYAGDGYDSTATGDTFIHDMIVTAGGNNIAKEGEFWSYSVETLVEQNPYMMFCGDAEGTKSRIQGLEGYKELTAVIEDRLYEVNADIFSRQGPRIGEAIEVLARFIHPEAFQ